MEAVLQIFKAFVRDHVILNVDTQRIEYKGQRILTEMFQIFESDPERLLPRNTAKRWQQASKEGKNGLSVITWRVCLMPMPCEFINSYRITVCNVG